jgi:hypothetical protein
MNQAVTQEYSVIFNEAGVFLTDLFAFQDKYILSAICVLLPVGFLALTFTLILRLLNSSYGWVDFLDFKSEILQHCHLKFYINFFKNYIYAACIFLWTLFRHVLFLNILLNHFKPKYFAPNNTQISFLSSLNSYNFILILITTIAICHVFEYVLKDNIDEKRTLVADFMFYFKRRFVIYSYD